MDVHIDHERTSLFAQEPEDVLAAVTAVSNHLREKGRAILSLRADGNPISPEQLVPSLKGKRPSDVTLLEVQSEDLGTLVNDSLLELERVLPDLPDACHRLAEVFQGETPESGYEPFQQLAGIWSIIKEREAHIANALDLDLDTLEVAGRAVGTIHTELNAYLLEAAEALKVGDCVLLGDLLEYELAPKAEAEKAIVALLRSRSQG